MRTGFLILSVLGLLAGLFLVFIVRFVPTSPAWILSLVLVAICSIYIVYFLVTRSKGQAAKQTTTGQQNELYTRDDRTVKSYTAYDFQSKHSAMTTIGNNKQWAIVHDIYEDPNKPYWEVWVRGKLKDHVFSEREAYESIGKYQTGEYT